MADIDLIRKRSFFEKLKKTDSFATPPGEAGSKVEDVEDERAFMDTLMQQISRLKESNKEIDSMIQNLIDMKNTAIEKNENENILLKRIESELERERNLSKSSEEKVQVEISRREILRSNFAKEIEQEKSEQSALFLKVEGNVNQRFEFAEKLQAISAYVKSNTTSKMTKSISKVKDMTDVINQRSSQELGKEYDILKSGELEHNE